MKRNISLFAMLVAWLILGCADAIAIVRRCLWSNYHFSTSGNNKDFVKVPRVLLERLTDAVCYAA